MISNVGDIAFIYRPVTAETLGPADYSVDGKDLVRDAALETAVIITLGTDARADDNDVLPQKDQNRNGYWGSVLLGFNLGTKLWLLGRSKITDQIVTTATQYVADGFEWMKRENMIDNAQVDGYRAGNYQINFDVVFTKPDSSNIAFSFSANWENQLTIGGA